jgi:hypothetical protein
MPEVAYRTSSDSQPEVLGIDGSPVPETFSNKSRSLSNVAYPEAMPLSISELWILSADNLPTPSYRRKPSSSRLPLSV